MRSWMIGVISGIMPLALAPSLPGRGTVLMLLAAAVVLSLSNRFLASNYFAGLLLGLALGIWHGHNLLDRRPNPACELETIHVDGVVSSLPRDTRLRDGDRQQRFEFSVKSIEPVSCTGPLTLQLSYYGEQGIRPGERWLFRIKLKRPWGLANPGAFNMQSWYSQNRIDAVGSVAVKAAMRLAGTAGLSFLHHELRQRVSRRLSTLPLSADTISVLRALTVADKSGMDNDLWRLFQYYGINHLLVISGLHIGLIAGLGFLLGRALGRVILLAGNHSAMVFLPGVIALLLATAYTAMAGFSLATNRALIMLVSIVFSSFLGRSSTAWNNLLIAAVLVLVLNPLAGLSSGFWLSFGAVACLLWLGLWYRGAWIRELLYTHAGMSLLMIPLGGWWFGGASLVAAISNFILIPLLGLIIVPMALLGATLQPIAPLLGDHILLAAGWPVEKLIPLGELYANNWEGKLFWTFSPSLVSVVLAIIGFALLLHRRSRGLIAVSVLLAIPLITPREKNWETSQYLAKLTVLDVGQGSAIILQGPEQVLVYDTGGGDPQGANMASAVILPYLRLAGVSSLDTLVVSHPDNDHSAGAGTLVSELTVRQFLYGGDFEGGATGHRCRAGQAWKWPSGIRFQVLSAPLQRGGSTNNSSCVLRIQVGSLQLLLPGDIDAGQERAIVSYWGEALHSDWLMAAHHGSKSSSSRLWIKYVQPSQLVFSSGYGNAFAHPHPEVLLRSADEGRSLYETSTGGALEFYLGRDTITQARAHRLAQKRYWF